MIIAFYRVTAVINHRHTQCVPWLMSLCGVEFPHTPTG